ERAGPEEVPERRHERELLGHGHLGLLEGVAAGPLGAALDDRVVRVVRCRTPDGGLDPVVPAQCQLTRALPGRGLEGDLRVVGTPELDDAHHEDEQEGQHERELDHGRASVFPHQPPSHRRHDRLYRLPGWGERRRGGAPPPLEDQSPPPPAPVMASAISWNVAETPPPSTSTAPSATMAMRATIRPYSTMVAPRSSSFRATIQAWMGEMRFVIPVPLLGSPDPARCGEPSNSGTNGAPF